MIVVGACGSSLALHGLQFVTPWITVADGKGKFLSHLELQLTASGDALTSVRWETEYVEETPPAHISMHTTWAHALEHDLDSALTFLFAASACITLALLYRVVSKHGHLLSAWVADVFGEGELVAEDADDGHRARQGDGRAHHHARTDSRLQHIQRAPNRLPHRPRLADASRKLD